MNRNLARCILGRPSLLLWDITPQRKLLGLQTKTPEMNSAYQIYLNWQHCKHEYEETKREQDRLGLKSDV